MEKTGLTETCPNSIAHNGRKNHGSFALFATGVKGKPGAAANTGWRWRRWKRPFPQRGEAGIRPTK